MNIETVTVGPMETNCYFAWNDGSRALVIDPGDDPAKILDCLKQLRLEVAGYAVTHGHVDHVSALTPVSRKRPARIGMHPADEPWAFGPENRLPPFYDVPERPVEIARFPEEGLQWNGIWSAYRIMHTPGHSPGSVCIYCPEENVVFSGDTLFRGSVGRTDLPGGNPDMLADSLVKLARLPGHTRVYPGHGPATTMEVEMRTNPFLAG